MVLFDAECMYRRNAISPLFLLSIQLHHKTAICVCPNEENLHPNGVGVRHPHQEKTNADTMSYTTFSYYFTYS